MIKERMHYIYADKTKLGVLVVFVILLMINTLGAVNDVPIYRMLQQVFKLSLFVALVYYSVKVQCIKGVGPLPNTLIVLFCYVLLLYSIFSFFFQNVLVSLNVLLSFCFFYYIGYKKQVKEKDLYLFFVLTFIISSLKFVFSFMRDLSEYGDVAGLGGDNLGYMLAILFPAFILFARKKMSIPIIIIAFLLILFSRKRGAIIAVSLPFILLMYSFFKMKSRNILVKGLKILIIMAVLVGLYNVLLNYYDIILGRFESGDGTSGRALLYMTVFKGWYNSESILEILFGHGFYSTTIITKEKFGIALYAHSDWLELIYDFGLIGLTIYALILLSLLHYLVQIFRKFRHYLLAYTSCMIVFVIKSVFSGVYLDADCVILMSIIGLIIGLVEREKKNNFPILSN
ncbi:O-antigen ligase family protein [Marinifilum sp. D737]|uniref:O-antigen ligase family protein n=1 Tax=Marinifilum sp. D737 TaxID=2969628 RepID=UPI002274879E|nr:O-antigen ligase family protein [Marinifilum sp. D737]MCY1634887.1 O-antigen ligase family protein [Marinifilum sp. D737]